MNHVKCIFNTNFPRRVSSSTGIIQRRNCGNEGSFKKRSSKPRSPSIDSSFIFAVKKVYPYLVQRQFNDKTFGDNTGEMLCGTQGSKSKSIATSLTRLFSEKKLPLRCIDGTNSKQAVRFGSSSSLSYDRTINYDDDKDSRSYAKMITAYNETMLTVDNASSIRQDQSGSKSNVQFSKTLFRATSTLTSSAYNFENVSIKKNTEKTSLTDLSYAIDTIIDNDEDIPEEKSKNFDLYSTAIVPEDNVRSYANIIADYSANMDINSIMSKYKNDFPKMSNVSFSPSKTTTLETSKVERNESELVSSTDRSTSFHKKVNTREEIEWLRKVEKIINDLKTATGKTSTKVNEKVSSVKENNVLECVTEQAVWVDKSTLTNKNKPNVETPRKTAALNEQTEESQNLEARAEKADKTTGVQAIHTSPPSNVDSTSRKDSTQIPKNTETNIPADPQVELRMMPSGNESIVSVNVEAIAKAMESRNPDSKELSVIVSSANKESMKSLATKENLKERNPNFGSMRISISEESLPVKELELSINGKLISDVRSIKARTETLDVMTSMDKVEIRVPYLQTNPGKMSPSTKSFVRNVKSTDSVLKLRIATAFDGIYPVVTTGVTKNVQAQSNIQPEATKAKYTQPEGSTTKMSEKADDNSSKKTFGYDVNQGKSEQSMWAKVRNKYKGAPTTLASLSGVNVNKSDVAGDIDLRLTKTFGASDSKINAKSATEVKKDNVREVKTVTDSKKAESSKDVKLTSEKKSGTTSLSDLISKHSGRSTDGSSSPVSGKPKVGFDKNREGSKPGGNKRESKTTEEVKKKSALHTESSKADIFDQRILSKWSPWWSASDTCVKLKKDEDYHRSYSTPTNVPPKTPKEPSRASEEEKTLSAKSQDLSKSKERKNETKESTSASSKVRDVEKTLQSPFKSENIRITRHDSPRVNEKSKRHSFSSRTKIVEEKLNKRNVGPSKKEAWNASMSKETKSRNDMDAKDEVKVSSKSAGIKNQAQENVVDAKFKDKLEKVDEKTRNEKLIHPKAASTNGFPEKHLNMQENVKKMESASNVTKPTKSSSNLSDDDLKLKNILNSMKPIEKKKDGTLIDYGVKVASRKKPEKFKGRSKSNVETRDVTKEKETADIRLDSQNDIKTSYTVEQIHLNMPNPIKYSPRNVDFKEEDKAKSETISVKEKDVNKDKNPVNLSAAKKESSSKPINSEKVDVKKESLNERISKVLEKAKDRLPYQSFTTESPNVKNVKEVQKSKEDSKEIKSEVIKPETIANNESLNERISKTLERFKDHIPYQIVKKESLKTSFKKEESMNIKKTEHKSDDDVREPFEGTVPPKPSKSSSDSVTGTTEPFAGTIVRSSKDLEKRKPQNVTYKHSSSTIKSPPKAIEKPNTPPTANILETKTNKNEGDSSGSQTNSGTPSSSVNRSNWSSSKMTKSSSHSLQPTPLEKANECDKLRCQEKVNQINVKPADEFVKATRPENELVYAVWLQRSEEKTKDKKP